MIGITGWGTYLPEERMTSEQIAFKSGLPQEVVEDKLGIIEKTVPGNDDHTVEMSIRAARKAIEKAKISPETIDVIISIGEEHKEYPLWTSAIKLQHDIGAVNAWAFDSALRCGTTVLAVKLARDMMVADPEVNTVLIAGGYRNVDFIDYSNPRTRFMYNLAAGGGALVIQREAARNRVLESHIITDGSFSEDVIVPVGGTKRPQTNETLNHGLYQLEVPDPAGMKERLDRLSMKHFITCIQKALDKSGMGVSDISYLAVLHMKPSAHQYVLDQLGLEESQSIYLNHYGHLGQIDQILSMELAEKQNKLKDGDVIVFVSAGIGYAWGANVIRWGEKE